MNKLNNLRFLDAFLDAGLFRIIYLITLSFETLAFFDKFAIYARCAVLVWGAFILLFKFVLEKRAFKVKCNWLILAFISVGFFTSLWNISKDFLPNMVFVYHSIVCFYLFYGMSEERSHKNIEKEMMFLFKYFIVFSTVTSFIGITVALFKARICVDGYFLGILRSRLIGIHTNSNLLAFCNIVAIFSLDIVRDRYFRHANKTKWLNKILIFGVLGINFLSLFLSDSNASFLFVIIYFTVRIFYRNFASYKEFKLSGFIRGNIFMIVCSALMVSGSFLVRDMSQELISLVINDIHKIEEPISDDISKRIGKESKVIEDYKDSDQITLGRENYDVSSGRITLLHQGLKLFEVNPIIGIGRGNLVAFGEKYLENGLIFSDLHNSYLTILVSYGIVGFSIFVLFSVLTALDMCKYLFKFSYRKDSGVYSKLFSGLVAYCAYSLFEKAILSEITFMVVFFWLILGFAISYMNNGLRESHSGE